jgi:hypothetical protein
MLASKESRRKELPQPSAILINLSHSPTNTARGSVSMGPFSLKFTYLSLKKLMALKIYLICSNKLKRLRLWPL